MCLVSGLASQILDWRQIYLWVDDVKPIQILEGRTFFSNALSYLSHFQDFPLMFQNKNERCQNIMDFLQKPLRSRLLASSLSFGNQNDTSSIFPRNIIISMNHFNFTVNGGKSENDGSSDNGGSNNNNITNRNNSTNRGSSTNRNESEEINREVPQEVRDFLQYTGSFSQDHEKALKIWM